MGVVDVLVPTDVPVTVELLVAVAVAVVLVLVVALMLRMYMFRRFGPPQYSEALPAQVIEQPFLVGSVPPVAGPLPPVILLAQ